MPYTCEDAKKDIDFYFSGGGKTTPEQVEALNRVLYKHMTAGSMPRKHIIACQECWNYYQKMKREHCGG